MRQPVLKYLFIFLLLPSALFGSKLPEITPRDVVATLGEIMEAHVVHKEISPLIVKRALERFLDEIDPTKTYLLEDEIALWLNPTEEQLLTIQNQVEKGDFSLFKRIQNLMLPAIERRHRLEKAFASQELPEKVSIHEFKELSWAKNEEELSDRLIRIRALQHQAAERLDKAFCEKAIQRIEKRQNSREKDFTTKIKADRERLMLAHVLKAFASSFDAHTAYFTPKEAAQFMFQIQQCLFGIGVQLRDDLNGFTIVKIIEGGPASRGTGLMVNDRVIAIDGEPVVGLEITDAVELIRGPENTKINLTVLRQQADEVEKHEIVITRGEVVIKRARIESQTYPFGDGVIAHIALHAFYQDPLYSSSADLYDEITKLNSEHKVKGIILDLRLNSGGVLPQAVAVTGLFITKGIVVSIKDNHGSIEHLRDIDGRSAYDGPLIVLTSKASASAAEIVAQTLQDYGRALVVGDEHTYGKGTFQTFTLDATNYGKVNPKGEYKVTRGLYYTVSGRSPQYVGVTPDIVVSGLYSTAEIGEQFSKYPLENDIIKENFHDDLSDIPVVQRDQISWLYRFNLQQRLKTFNRHIPLLKTNSATRLTANKFYQSFLADIENEELARARIELYTQGDPQLHETVSIMKDLISLME